MADARALAADLLLRIGVDASGVDAELASRLTRTERAAVASGDRIASGVARGADKATAAQLRVVAATERLQRTLQKEGATQGQIASAQAGVISARTTYARETERATKATERQTRATSSLLSQTKLLVGGAAVFGAGRFLGGGIEELKDFESGLAQTRAGIQSTGGVAKVSARDVQELAGEIQAYSGYTDDSVVAAENLLLTFTKVRNELGRGNDVFDRATVAAADLAARGFGDLETNAKQLGKALNDPVKGTGALARAGVQFTASQKEQIKALVESGRTLEAQKIILKEVETQVGGSARAFGETLPGEIARSKRSLEDFEQSTVSSLRPAISALAGVAGFFAEHKTARDVALWAGGITVALVGVNKGVKLYGEISQNVFRRQGTKVTANLAVAQSYNAVSVAAGRAAAAEAAAAGTSSVAAAAQLRSALLTQSAASRFGGLTTRAGAAGVAAAGGPVGVGIAGSLIIGPEAFKAGRESKDEGLLRFKSLASMASGVGLLSFAAGRFTGGDDDKQAKDRVLVINQTTGALEELTEAEAKAATAEAKAAEAATKHKDAVRQQAEEFERLRDSFAVDVFAPSPRKASGAAGLTARDVLSRLGATTKDRKQYARDVARLASAGVSQEGLSRLVDLDKQIPGTIRRIVQGGIKPAFTRELNKGLASEESVKTALAKTFRNTDTLAEQKGKRDGAAYRKGFIAGMSDLGSYINSRGSEGAGPRADKDPSGFTRPRLNPSRDRLFNAGFPAP